MTLNLRSLTVAALLMCAPALPAATTTIFATDARNVSDYEVVFPNGGGIVIVTDGLGDERGLPLYPLLGAGIFLSGASGQNGTARFQAEFDLSSLVGQPILSAFLVLDSDYAANQTLSTMFYHVTTNEEGEVTTNDFQSAVEPTGIVQPPVFADATHMYDVTGFVKQDILAGFGFTSYQGRVDEGIDNVFRRGVEYRSMSNDVGTDPALRPRLVVTFGEVPEPATMLLTGGGMLALVALRRRRSLRG